MATDGGNVPPLQQRQWRSEQCIAICDYQAQDLSEISFRKGDVISVTGKRGDASGFWEGITTGVNMDIITGKRNKLSKEYSKKGGVALSGKGLFPTCMVSSNMRAFNEPRFCDKVLVLYDYSHKTPDEADLVKGDVWTVLRPSKSPGWWYGIKEGSGQRVGENAMSGPINSKSAQRVPNAEKLIPINFVSTKLCVGGLPCQGNATNELPFGAGDVLHVIRRWNDGWWEGMLRGKRGIFPSNLVHPNVSTLSPPLFCQRCKNTLQYIGSTGAMHGVGRCSECAEHERVVELMLLALSDRGEAERASAAGGGAGTLPKLDLFSRVDGELLYGKKLFAELHAEGTRGDVPPSGVANLEITTVRRFQGVP